MSNQRLVVLERQAPRSSVVLPSLRASLDDLVADEFSSMAYDLQQQPDLALSGLVLLAGRDIVNKAVVEPCPLGDVSPDAFSDATDLPRIQAGLIDALSPNILDLKHINGCTYAGIDSMALLDSSWFLWTPPLGWHWGSQVQVADYAVLMLETAANTRSPLLVGATVTVGDGETKGLGQAIIDGDLRLVNSLVYYSPDAATITPNSEATAESYDKIGIASSHIRGCTQTWYNHYTEYITERVKVRGLFSSKTKSVTYAVERLEATLGTTDFLVRESYQATVLSTHHLLIKPGPTVAGAYAMVPVALAPRDDEHPAVLGGIDAGIWTGAPDSWTDASPIIEIGVQNSSMPLNMVAALCTRGFGVCRFAPTTTEEGGGDDHN